MAHRTATGEKAGRKPWQKHPQSAGTRDESFAPQVRTTVPLEIRVAKWNQRHAVPASNKTITELDVSIFYSYRHCKQDINKKIQWLIVFKRPSQWEWDARVHIRKLDLAETPCGHSHRRQTSLGQIFSLKALWFWSYGVPNCQKSHFSHNLTKLTKTEITKQPENTEPRNLAALWQSIFCTNINLSGLGWISWPSVGMARIQNFGILACLLKRSKVQPPSRPSRATYIAL